MSSINIHDILNSPFNKPKQEVPASALADVMNGKKKELKIEYEFPEKSFAPGTMKVHIEIHREDKRGDMDIKADIDNQGDLEAFWNKTKDYMPRKKFLGLI